MGNTFSLTVACTLQTFPKEYFLGSRRHPRDSMNPLPLNLRTKSWRLGRRSWEIGRTCVSITKALVNPIFTALTGFLVLEMLGTLPKWRRKGAGCLQIAWAVAIADQHKLALWTEGSPMALSLYGKWGFVPKGTVEMELHSSAGGGAYTYTALLREPQDPCYPM
jgi:GNAT superfamily N-acetyltransferase